jgi:hypothetical protein
MEASAGTRLYQRPKGLGWLGPSAWSRAGRAAPSRPGPEPDRQQGHQHRRRRGHLGQAGQPALSDRHTARRFHLGGHHPPITAPTPRLPVLPVIVAGQRPSRHHLKRVRFRSSRPALRRTRQHPPSLTHLRSKSGRGCRPPVMAGFAKDVQAAGIRGVGPLYTHPELRFGAEVGCDSAAKPRFWELAGD